MKKKLLSLLLTVLIILAIIFYLYHNQNDFKIIQKIKFIYIIPIIGLLCFTLYLNGIFMAILSKPFNIVLRRRFLLSIASSFFNMITPFRGGVGFKALYMKKRHNLSYSDFGASMFGSYIIILLSTAILGLLSLMILYFQFKLLNVFFISFFSGSIIATILVIKLNLKFSEKYSVFRLANKILGGWKKISSDKDVILKLTVNNLIAIVSNAFLVKLIMLSLGLEISIVKAVLLSTMSIVSSFLNITPGGIGVLEGLYGFTSDSLGIPSGIGITIALILRVTSSIVLLIGGPISYKILSDSMKVKNN